MFRSVAMALLLGSLAGCAVVPYPGYYGPPAGYYPDPYYAAPVYPAPAYGGYVYPWPGFWDFTFVFGGHGDGWGHGGHWGGDHWGGGGWGGGWHRH